MNGFIDLCVNNIKHLEEIVEDISNNRENCNINENLFDSIGQLSKDEIEETLFGDFDKYIKKLNTKYEKADRIINPAAVRKMMLVRKAILGIKDILCDDIGFKESLHNNLGWKYTIVLRCSYFGMTGNAMTLLKIAMLMCNSFEIIPEKHQGSFQLWFTVNDIYKVFP